ncbi:MAG: hypothetical protein V3T08_03005, partial [Gemmatimonadota bacterium]
RGGGHDTITRAEITHTRAQRLDPTRPLVPEPAGKFQPRVAALEHLEIGPTGERELDPGQDFPVARLREGLHVQAKLARSDELIHPHHGRFHAQSKR